MKNYIFLFLSFFIFKANAQYKLYGSIYDITSLKYASTYGLGFNLGFSKNKNSFYASTGISTTPPSGKVKDFSNVPIRCVFMKLNVGFLHNKNLYKKLNWNYGTEVGLFDINMDYFSLFPVSIIPNVGLDYPIYKRLSFNISLQNALSYRKEYWYVEPKPTGKLFYKPASIHYLPYFQIGICYR